jgi:homospermidine synthase
MTKINIKDKKILFLGYGAVAKGVWNYFHQFFDFSYKNVFLVDKVKTAFYGPNLEAVKKIIINVDTINIEKLLKFIKFSKGDIIIDLTTHSCTYFFIDISFRKGYYYINTSIEDDNDKMFGASIDCQQKMIKNIAKKYKGKEKSTILTECGQNPGLIQHYVFYALNKMNKSRGESVGISDYRKSTMKKIIKDFKVGTILLSEIDNIELPKEIETKLEKKKI